MQIKKVTTEQEENQIGIPLVWQKAFRFMEQYEWVKMNAIVAHLDWLLKPAESDICGCRYLSSTVGGRDSFPAVPAIGENLSAQTVALRNSIPIALIFIDSGDCCSSSSSDLFTLTWVLGPQKYHVLQFQGIVLPSTLCGPDRKFHISQEERKSKLFRTSRKACRRGGVQEG